MSGGAGFLPSTVGHLLVTIVDQRVLSGWNKGG